MYLADERSDHQSAGHFFVLKTGELFAGLKADECMVRVGAGELNCRLCYPGFELINRQATFAEPIE